MAKAHITTKEGIEISIEGNPKEVADLINQIKDGLPISKSKKKPTKGRKVVESVNSKPTPVNLISSLIDGGFFKKAKDLASVKVALEELGHLYPVTTLSPVLLRLVRKRQLRRIKDKKRWLYTGS